jgi:hypothetical protein
MKERCGPAWLDTIPLKNFPILSNHFWSFTKQRKTKQRKIKQRKAVQERLSKVTHRV